MNDLGLCLHATKRYIGKLSNGFDFLGYRVVPGRRLRTSAERSRRFAEKFRRLYEQGADHRRLWRYAERWCRWQRAGLDGLVSLKDGLVFNQSFVKLFKFSFSDFMIVVFVNISKSHISTGHLWLVFFFVFPPFFYTDPIFPIRINSFEER